MKNNTRALVITALGLALAIVLPFLTGQIPAIGSMLLPMHLPVLLVGFICGWPYGLLLGLIAAPFRFLLFQMPPLFGALAMSAEMAAYGAVAGFMYKNVLKKQNTTAVKKTVNIYISLITAMIAGRIAWGLASYVIQYSLGNQFTWKLFAAGAFVNAIPGIILQLVLVPLLVVALEKSNIIRD